MAESIIGLIKTEIIGRDGPWRTLEAVEYATLECMDCINNRWLLSRIGDVRLAERERACDRPEGRSVQVAGLS